MKTSVSGYTMDEVRSAFEQRLKFDRADHDGDYFLNPDMRNDIFANAKKDAAVLIGIVEREEGANLILTKRTEQLSSHSGQVAFPGGKIDADDASPEDAALREAWEEIGLDRNEVEIPGRMPDYYSGSGFKIAPVIGFVKPGADFEINPDEVEYMFEVPLSFLMNQDNHIEGNREFAGRTRYYLEMPYGKHFIWGVTAGMIRALHDRIFAA